MTEDSQRSALAELVGAISGLETALRWGSGKTSASDGQRFALPRKVLQRTYSPRISDFALEFYTFLADNYAPYYTMPIECSDRDAAFVLDGLLYNESDLDLEEHYVDTHGYTEINFAAFTLLGRRFCPRTSAAFRASASTASSVSVTTVCSPAWSIALIAPSTPVGSPNSGIVWASSMPRLNRATQQRP